MDVKNNAPIIIAGPCSVESEEQLSAVCGALAAMPQVRAIRCGVWKPRSKPGGFEGLGEAALAIADSVRQRHPHLPPLCCEVATPAHVELCLRHGISLFWIGARTTTNPFMVEELTQALRGTHAAMMVKNPLSPDVRLWAGAIERFQNTLPPAGQGGLPCVAAIHRGFVQYGESNYRNSPLWEVPIELHRLMPEVPLLCDPSHIAGRSPLVAPLAQQALDLHFDGLMIEVHHHPAEAMTDASQQLSPAEFRSLVEGLVMRRATGSVHELDICRKEIDDIDHQLLVLLARRMRLSGDIATIKSQHNMAIYQPERWEAVLQQLREQAATLQLDPSFIESLYGKIHAESIRTQETVIDPTDRSTSR